MQGNLLRGIDNTAKNSPFDTTLIKKSLFQLEKNPVFTNNNHRLYGFHSENILGEKIIQNTLQF